jgi:integrase
LIAAAPDEEWKALVALGFYCGGRLRDLARLTWGAWDRDKQTLTFAQKKTGGVVLLPIHPELVKYLERLPSGIARASLLPTLSAKSGTGRSGLSMWFRRIMLVAGIQPGVARERAGKAGHSVSKLSFHSLRHSFTSELAKAGVSPEIRQRLTGHADLASHKVYTHHEVSTFRRAISALPALP